MRTTEKLYLGDGVYVQTVDQANKTIKLTTEDGVEETNTIYLEPHVADALVKYLTEDATA